MKSSTIGRATEIGERSVCISTWEGDVEGGGWTSETALSGTITRCFATTTQPDRMLFLLQVV